MIEHNISLHQLLKKSDNYQIFGNEDLMIDRIAYDSRKVEQGTCFVAIKGELNDGHNFIKNAIIRGANSIVCESLPDDYKDFMNVTFVLTTNSRQLLAEISNSYYDYPADKLTILGITGTNGKTTCTFLFKSICEAAGLKCGIIGTTGIFVGNDEIPATHTTPESLELFEILARMVKNEVKYVALEVSSHSLTQFRVHGIDFKVAVFTNLTHDHLDYHKNMSNYAEAKKILFNSLKSDAYAIINSESEWSDFMTENISCSNIYKVGRNDKADYIIQNEIVDLNGISFELLSNNHKYDVESSLTGRFNVDNAAIIAVTASMLGFSQEIILKGLSISQGAPGRMQRVLLKSGAVALVDYAHTPDALEKALKTCRNILTEKKQNNSKLICVFGCGGDRDKTKRPEMGTIASANSDFTIITSDNPRTENPEKIIEDILAGMDSNSGYEILQDRRLAIARAADYANNGDIILIAGKGHENYQIVGIEKQHFDDYEEISKFI